MFGVCLQRAGFPLFFSLRFICVALLRRHCRPCICTTQELYGWYAHLNICLFIASHLVITILSSAITRGTFCSYALLFPVLFLSTLSHHSSRVGDFILPGDMFSSVSPPAGLRDTTHRNNPEKILFKGILSRHLRKRTLWPAPFWLGRGVKHRRLHHECNQNSKMMNLSKQSCSQWGGESLAAMAHLQVFMPCCSWISTLQCLLCSGTTTTTRSPTLI